MSDLRARFASEIRVARLAAGMTQEQLAEAASTSVDFLSKIERGLNSPSLETLAALVRALSLDLTRLFDLKTSQPRLPAARLELEARAVHAARQLDDRMLAALIEIAGTLKRAQQRDKSESAERKRR